MDRLKQFRKDITAFLKKNSMTKTAMGLNALKDPHIIFRCLKAGGDMRFSTVQKLYDYMESYKRK